MKQTLFLMVCAFLTLPTHGLTPSNTVENTDAKSSSPAAMMTYGTYKFIDADTDQVLNTYTDPTTVTFALDQLNAQQLFSIEAVVPAADVSLIKKVRFITNDTEPNWTEGTAPYVYKGDVSGDYTGYTPVLNSAVTFTVNYYDQTNITGVSPIHVDTFTISFVDTIPPPTGSLWSSTGNNIYFDTGNVGMGTNAFLDGNKLRIRQDVTTDRTYGYTGLFAWSSSSNTAGQISRVKGAHLLSLNNSTGTLDESIGAQMVAGNESSASGTVNTAYGAIISVQDGSGTVNDGYGLYIEKVEGTNTYGLYQVESSVNNYFAGNLGIGTTNIGSWKLAVDGNIRAREVKVDNDAWPDYVFEKDYKLPSLQEVETHIKEKGHLINIPSAAEVEANGVYLGEMNKLLLEKIEELTLYILQQERKLKDQASEIERLQDLEKRILQLENSAN